MKAQRTEKKTDAFPSLLLLIDMNVGNTNTVYPNTSTERRKRKQERMKLC